MCHQPGRAGRARSCRRGFCFERRIPYCAGLLRLGAPPPCPSHTLDPAARVTAQAAIEHAYFTAEPPPASLKELAPLPRPEKAPEKARPPPDPLGEERRAAKVPKLNFDV